MFNQSCYYVHFRANTLGKDIVAFSYTCSCRIHTDAMNNRRRKTSLTKYLPLTLLQGFEKGYSKFVCERELETEQNWNILTPTLMAVNVVSFSFSWCSTGGPGCWLSLLHLISNFSGPQTPSGFPRAPSAACGFPYHHSSITPSPALTATHTQLSWVQSWLSYIIVQRPLNRPLDLWNHMFDRHQAEITVMQFTGHSLLVCQSMSVPWEFFSLSHSVNQFPPTRFPLLSAIGMCHFLPVHHVE